MKIEWKEIKNNDEQIINAWLSEADKHNLCMSNKSWQETANDISVCLKDMKNGQFKNVIGYINNQPAIAMMFGVEHSGEILNLYNIVVNPIFRHEGVAKQALSSLIYNCEKEFGLKQTYKQIKASVVPKNTISKNLFFGSGFTSCQFDGEYLVYTKYFQKNYENDFSK